MEKTINLTQQEINDLQNGYEVHVAGRIAGNSGILHLRFEAN